MDDRTLEQTVDAAREADLVFMSIKAALENAGIEFTNGDAPGVRMKRR
jgi:hypothetical protein